MEQEDVLMLIRQLAVALNDASSIIRGIGVGVDSVSRRCDAYDRLTAKANEMMGKNK